MVVGFDVTVTANLSTAQAQKMCDVMAKRINKSIKRYLETERK